MLNRNILFIANAFVIILTFGCAPLNTIPIDSINMIPIDSNISLKDYSKITFMPIKVDKFWEENPKYKEDDKMVFLVDDASVYIRRKVSNHFKNKKAPKGTKELKVVAELFLFEPGSGAKRFFIGFGAGKGEIAYHVKLIDGETGDLIGTFDSYGSIIMGLGGGDIRRTYRQCAKTIISFIEENSY